MPSVPPVPPSPEAMINGKRATLFRAGPPPVYLVSDGRFAIHIAAGDKWIIKSSMKAIDNEIAKKRKYLKLFKIYCGGLSNKIETYKTEAVAITDTQYTDREGKKHNHSYRNLYVFDAGISERLTELEKLRSKYEKEIEKAREAIMKKLICVRVSNFAEILEQHGEEVS